MGSQMLVMPQAKWRRRAKRCSMLPASLRRVPANRSSERQVRQVRRVRHSCRELVVLQQHQRVRRRRDHRVLRVRAEAVGLAPLGYRGPRDSLPAADFGQPVVVAAAAVVHFEFRADFARK